MKKDLALLRESSHVAAWGSLVRQARNASEEDNRSKLLRSKELGEWAKVEAQECYYEANGDCCASARTRRVNIIVRVSSFIATASRLKSASDGCHHGKKQ